MLMTLPKEAKENQLSSASLLDLLLLALSVDVIRVAAFLGKESRFGAGQF
jgi:hypothetical protein